MAFKMKGNPMKRNFGKHIPKYKTNIPGINNKSEGNTDKPDGRSASSALQYHKEDHNEPTVAQLKASLAKGEYTAGPRKGTKLGERDRIHLQDMLDDMQAERPETGKHEALHGKSEKMLKTLKQGFKTKKSPAKDKEMIRTVDGRTIDMHKGDASKPRGSKEHKHSTSYIAMKKVKTKGFIPAKPLTVQGFDKLVDKSDEKTTPTKKKYKK